jgi:APA family basic amino acid/polyamine antiporter
MDTPRPTKELPTTEGQNLLRILGVTFGLAIVVGGMIGGGILRTPGFVAAQLEIPLLIIAVWVFGGVYAFFAVNTYAELGTMLPKAGGAYVFARRSYGDYGGFLVGWSDWFLQTSTMAYLTIALGEYTAGLFPALSDSIVPISIAILFLLAFLNWIGLRMGSRIQKLTSLLKAVAFAIIIGACFVYGGGVAPPSERRLLISSPTSLFVAIILALQAVQETYAGWNNPVYFSEEDTNPEKNIPRSMFFGVLIVMVIYVMFNMAMLYVLPMDGLAASKLPAADAAQVVFGGASGQIITSLALLSMLGILNVQVLLAPRIIFALGRGGLFFRQVTAVNKGGTPTLALAITVVVSAIWAATGTFELMLGISAFLGLLVDLSVFLSLFILRRSEPELPRPYQARGYPVIPMITLIGSGSLFLAYIISNPNSSLFGLTAVLISYPLYLVFVKINRSESANT